MKEAKEYKFKHGNYIVYAIMATFMGGCSLYLLVLAVKELNPFIFILIGIVPGYLSFLTAYIARIDFQFTRYDRGKQIIISEDRDTLTWKQYGQTVTISNADVEKVEVYEELFSRTRGSGYDYMVIYTTYGNMVITKLTISMLEYDIYLTKFLRKKPRHRFKKRFNFIDEIKFPT